MTISHLPGFAGFFPLDTIDSNVTLAWHVSHAASTQAPRSERLMLELLQSDHDRIYTYSDKHISVVFAGEIYRETELARKYGLSIEEMPPAQLIAAAYLSGGDAALQDIEGVYCACVYDKLQPQVTLLRDDSGFRYLYYCFDPKAGLTFATDMELLLSKPGMRKKISHQSLHEFLRTLEVYAPNTIFENVFAVDPGSLLKFNGKTIESVPSPKRDPIDSSSLSFNEAAQGVEELLTKSLGVRLAGKRLPAFFLSGGIDSSLLCCIGSELAGKQIDAFTVGFKEQTFDEMSTAAAIARHIGIRHHELYFETGEYETCFEMLARLSDQPFSDPAGMATLLAFEKIAQTADAVIDGTGADTLVGTMPPRYKRIAVQYASLVPLKGRRCITRILKTIPRLDGYSKIFDFDEPHDLLIRWQAWRTKEIEQLCGEPVSLKHTRLYQICAAYHRNEHFDRYNAIIRNTSDDRIHEAGRHTGVRARFPFWDRDLASFIEGLNREYLYTQDQPKRVLRHLLEKRIPKEIWDLPKHAFNFPFIQFQRINNCSLLRSHLSRQELDKHGLFNSNIVADYLSRFLSGDNTVAFRIWGLLIFQAWYRNHFV